MASAPYRRRHRRAIQCRIFAPEAARIRLPGLGRFERSVCLGTCGRNTVDLRRIDTVYTAV